MVNVSEFLQLSVAGVNSWLFAAATGWPTRWTMNVVALCAVLIAGILGYAMGRSWPRWVTVGGLGVAAILVGLLVAFPHSFLILIVRLVGVVVFGGYCYRRGSMDANQSGE